LGWLAAILACRRVAVETPRFAPEPAAARSSRFGTDPKHFRADPIRFPELLALYLESVGPLALERAGALLAARFARHR
jgi:hypothetical protein